MKPIRIAMIGYGGIGRVHVMAYRSLPYHYGLPASAVQVAAVATSRPETAAAAAAEIGCDVYTADDRELLARPDRDAVDLCTPNRAHGEIVVAAAQAGKHIYCEKPLAMSVAEGRRMVAAAQAAGVQTQMTFNFRFFPALLRAKQLVDEGFLGRLFSFRGRYYRSSYIDSAKPLSWRLQKAASGGGALVDHGSHINDLLYMLLGEFHSVPATLETLIKERPLSAGATETGPVDVDDIALLHARAVSGALGLVEISRMGTGCTNDLEFELFGDQGSLRWSVTDPGFLHVYDARQPEQPLGGRRGFTRVETVGRYPGQKAPDWSMAPGFVRAHAECQWQFIRAIAQGRPAAPTLADGLHVQAVMEAAERSSARGGWVSIEDVLQGLQNNSEE